VNIEPLNGVVISARANIESKFINHANNKDVAAPESIGWNVQVCDSCRATVDVVHCVLLAIENRHGNSVRHCDAVFTLSYMETSQSNVCLKSLSDMENSLIEIFAGTTMSFATWHYDASCLTYRTVFEC